jgi:hypothetical protein
MQLILIMSLLADFCPMGEAEHQQHASNVLIMLIIEVIFVFVLEQVYRKASGMTMSLLADFYSFGGSGSPAACVKYHGGTYSVQFCSLLDG